MDEALHQVVWPLGRTIYKSVSLKPGITDLKGKTICEFSDFAFRTERVFPLLRGLLSKRYPGVKFVEYETFGNIHGPDETALVSNLPALLNKYKCDAVISGLGG